MTLTAVFGTMASGAMERKAVIIVKGRVQGVFFRASATEKATALGVRGRVENLADGSVKILAEGTGKNLEELVEWCGEGPPRAAVESVEVEWTEPAGEFRDFRIR